MSSPIDQALREQQETGTQPILAGAARRRLGWLANWLVSRGGSPDARLFRPGGRGWWTPRRCRLRRTLHRQGIFPDKAFLERLTERGLLRRVGDGYDYSSQQVRDHLAELWRRRGPGGMTVLPTEARLHAGWAAGQGPRPTSGNAIEFLVDNEAAWGRLAEEVGSARRSIRGMLFMLDVPHVRMAFRRDPLGNPGPAGSVRLEEQLVEAAQRGAEVHVLLNHVTPAFSPANTSRQVERFFRIRAGRKRVKLRRLRTPQSVPIHAKVFVIDDQVAYLIGSVFAQEYYDGPRHAIDDPRRGHIRWRSSVRAPVHDVSVRIEGPAVADLDQTFRLHWDHCHPAGESELPPVRGPSEGARPGGSRLQVTRTLHGARYDGLAEGETGIYESYLRAIANAKRFIYLENQYLTWTEIVDALVCAIKETPGLQLIALLNIKPDVPNYIAWQRQAIERLLTRLGEDRDRAGIFTLWSHEKTGHGDGTRMLRTHVHSKVAIVDDTWLTIGSANLDGVSLVASEHQLHRPPLARVGRLLGALSPGDPWQARATEVNVTCSGEDGLAPPECVSRLRRLLWAEHLGYDTVDDAALAHPPEGGWLALWRQRAELKLAGLRATQPTVQRPRILPYPHTDGRLPVNSHDEAAYLRALDVNDDLIEVRRKFRSFSFSRGQWR